MNLYQKKLKKKQNIHELRLIMSEHFVQFCQSNKTTTQYLI